MKLKLIFLLGILVVSFTSIGQNKNSSVQICKDTNYFVRTKFVNCDSTQPVSLCYKKGKFYESNKSHSKEEVFRECFIKNDFSDSKYFIFITKNGKRIEEGYYAGIGEIAFCRGAYKSYYPSGKAKVIGEYDNHAFKNGKWKFFNEKGELIKEEMYEKGKRVSANPKE